MLPGLKAALPDSESSRLAALTPAQRSKAVARYRAFHGWQSRELSFDEAVAASGLSRSRFYRLAADWRAAPSLAALGVSSNAKVPRERLDPVAVGKLQSVVADVVRLNEGASTSQLVRLMVERAGLNQAQLPGTTRLRDIVENEKRRVAATGEAGHTVMFDCTAINLPQQDGRPHILFALVDKGTRLILGAAVGPTADTTRGYAQVALDVWKRTSASLSDLLWAQRNAQIYLTAGLDIAAAEGEVLALMKAGVRTVQLKRSPRRYGSYFREVIGDRIGRVAITPSRTEEGEALPDNGDMTPWSEDEAAAAVSHAVEQHNAVVLADTPLRGGTPMPDDLNKALRLLAAVR